MSEIPDDAHANTTAHIDQVNKIFDSIDGVETHLSDLETLIDEAATPPSVEDQLRAVDEQLFEIKQQLAESWGVECFTQPVTECDDADCEPGDCSARSEVVAQ